MRAIFVIALLFALRELFASTPPPRRAPAAAPASSTATPVEPVTLDAGPDALAQRLGVDRTKTFIHLRAGDSPCEWRAVLSTDPPPAIRWSRGAPGAASESFESCCEGELSAPFVLLFAGFASEASAIAREQHPCGSEASLVTAVCSHNARVDLASTGVRAPLPPPGESPQRACVVDSWAHATRLSTHWGPPDDLTYARLRSYEMDVRYRIGSLQPSPPSRALAVAWGIAHDMPFGRYGFDRDALASEVWKTLSTWARGEPARLQVLDSNLRSFGPLGFHPGARERWLAIAAVCELGGDGAHAEWARSLAAAH